jgi:hypothetical protein
MVVASFSLRLCCKFADIKSATTKKNRTLTRLHKKKAGPFPSLPLSYHPLLITYHLLLFTKLFHQQHLLHFREGILSLRLCSDPVNIHAAGKIGSCKCLFIVSGVLFIFITTLNDVISIGRGAFVGLFSPHIYRTFF